MTAADHDDNAIHPYASLDYASAFDGCTPVLLPSSGTYVLKRPIPGTSQCDAIGCYPVCVLNGHEGLSSDLRLLAAQGVVALVLVTDCMTQPDGDYLRAHFERCRPYKTHFVYDASAPNCQISKHHRDRIRRARRACECRVVPLSEHLDTWMECYGTLVERRRITGIQNFPRSYFERVARLEGTTLIAAFVDGVFAAGHIWVRHRRHVYAHLAASSALGYKERSAFAIYDHAIELFGPEAAMDFGGGAGVETASDGLADFKRGFANVEKQNYLCGAVLNRKAYDDLCASRGVRDSETFFPAYRAPLPVRHQAEADGA